MGSSDAPQTRVVFFQVQNPGAKIARICETARAHFEKKERLIFFCEDAKALHFVDELLWKTPEASFLPHAISDEETQEWIAITKSKTNVNGARIAFNLCSTPLLIETPFRIIYEFEDLTAPNKQKLSALRFDSYKQARALIEAR